MVFSIAPIFQTTHYLPPIPFIFLHISQPSVIRFIGWDRLVKICNILDLLFFGRNDATAETPVLWPRHAKSWLIGKDSDAGRDWGQEEKGTTEDEMAGWHHGLDESESEWTLGVGDGQGGVACWDSWGGKESDMTEWLNWTDWAINFRTWFIWSSFFLNKGLVSFFYM